MPARSCQQASWAGAGWGMQSSRMCQGAGLGGRLPTHACPSLLCPVLSVVRQGLGLGSKESFPADAHP